MLESYHQLALKDLIQKSGLIGLSTSSIKFLLGFSELQISQVFENCDKLFSLDDVVKYVEIWDIRHAHKIMDIINRTFGDGYNIQLDETCEESDDSDDDYLDIPEEWNLLLNDDDLLDLEVDNLSTSLFDISIDNPDNSTDTVSIPNAAVCAIEQMTISPVED